MMKRFWDKMAKGYDKSTNKIFGEANKKIVHITKKYCNNQDTILDIGCGTGLIIKDLAAVVKKIKAIDLSAEMIAQAKENKIANVEWEVNDLFSIKKNQENFSMITAFNILLYLEEVETFLENIYEMLPQGGYFISVTDCLGESGGIGQYIKLTGCKLGILPYMKNYKKEELIELIASKGFRIEHSEDVYEKTHNELIVARKIDI